MNRRKLFGALFGTALGSAAVVATAKVATPKYLFALVMGGRTEGAIATIQHKPIPEETFALLKDRNTTQLFMGMNSDQSIDVVELIRRPRGGRRDPETEQQFDRMLADLRKLTDENRG